MFVMLFNVLWAILMVFFDAVRAWTCCRRSKVHDKTRSQYLAYRQYIKQAITDTLQEDRWVKSDILLRMLRIQEHVCDMLIQDKQKVSQDLLDDVLWLAVMRKDQDLAEQMRSIGARDPVFRHVVYDIDI
jgi:hypothetical protein